MPVLRSSVKRKRSDFEASKENMKTKVIKIEEQSQWIFFLPENVIEKDTTIMKLPHPQNGVDCLFAFENNVVYELMKYKEDYRSWFIDESVQEDGSINMLTIIDPVFLLIPYLGKTMEQNKYLLLDDILHDDSHSKALTMLEACLNDKVLKRICNCKGSEDYKAYKLDEDKLLNWLQKKVRKLADHFQNTDINVCSGGSQISSYVRNSAGKKNEDHCIRYAWTMISDYVSPSWSNKLKEKLSIKDPIKEVKLEQEPPIKKQKLNNNNEEKKLEDYRDHDVKKKEKATPKLTAAQKKIKKVDKTGMKSLSSFFKAKSK